MFEAYSPLGTPGRPAWNDNDPAMLLADTCIMEIANKHKATPAQVCTINPLIRDYLDDFLILFLKDLYFICTSSWTGGHP